MASLTWKALLWSKGVDILMMSKSDHYTKGWPEMADMLNLNLNLACPY
jgi:hypothetical protein